MSAAAYPPMDPSTAPGSLDAPLYGASFGQAVRRFFRKYATFTGRAGRGEFWWAFLVVAAVHVALIAITVTLAISTSYTDAAGERAPGYGLSFVLTVFLWFAATIVPLLAIVVRRFHDANLSGLLALLWLVPYVGLLIVLIMCLLPSHPGGRRFDLGALPVYGYPPFYGQPQGYGQPVAYGQPVGYGQPPAYGRPPAYGWPPVQSSPAETEHAIRAAVATAPDHRAAVAAVAAQRGFQVVPDGSAADRLVAPFGTLVVSYDASGRVSGVSTS